METEWNPSTRAAFRFAFAYFGLYSVLSHLVVYLFVLPGILPGQGLGTFSPLFDITSWAAVHVLGITAPLVYTGNSRDTNFFWAQLFVVSIAAAITTVVWLSLDRRRKNHDALHKWSRLFIRFLLAAQMFYFGMVKVIPTQFPAPSLITLLAPVGNLSLQGFLWTSIGVSPAYQIFTGVVEVVGGLLLIAPRTVTLGALICLASMIQVFVLNMTYDVGVKILSFQLVLMSLFLLAPDLRVLMNVFVFKRSGMISFAEPQLFESLRANRICLAVQIMFGVYLLGAYTDVGRTFWYADGGGGSPRSLLYGIWDVKELSLDGQSRQPQLNDYDRRWRRVVFDSPQWIFFQRTDDSFMRYGVSIDAQQNTLALTKGHSRTWQSHFTFQRDSDELSLEGEMDGHIIQIKLERLQLDTFRVLNSRFRWVRPPDPDTE